MWGRLVGWFDRVLGFHKHDELRRKSIDAVNQAEQTTITSIGRLAEMAKGEMDGIEKNARKGLEHTDG